MYADDTVIFSEIVDGLQHMLGSLERYFLNWKSQVNVSKTNIVVFRNGGKIKETEQWFYKGTLIDIMDDFNYLGVSFRYNGNFHITQKTIAAQAQRMVFGLKRSVSNFYLNKETELSLFDICSTYFKLWM